MANTAPRPVQHPTHEHPLVQLDSSLNQIARPCHLCRREIWTKAYYTCQEGCKYYCYHKACVEAPPQLESHPLHPVHPLILSHSHPVFNCNACGEDRDACGEYFFSGGSSFRCDECKFDLHICCAVSSLSDVGSYQSGETTEQITLPFHPHALTSFFTRHEFVGDSKCYICQGSVEGDGYMCLRRYCEFNVHKKCIQDLNYPDGTKAPRVYHGHPLKTFVGEDTGSSTCASCGSNKSGEFIGCACCQVFYHRQCFQVPEDLRYPSHNPDLRYPSHNPDLRYPSHNPDHTLVLFLHINTLQECQSCSVSLKDEIYYRCASCDFFVHVGCALQVLAYCEGGMSAQIDLSWHKHPLLLCHRTISGRNRCSYCEDASIGPSYLCQETGCEFLLHKRCTEIESKITHPHHPHHPLTLCEKRDDDNLFHLCSACGDMTARLSFLCESCIFHLHVKCAGRFPTHKHYLHEHNLLRFENDLLSKCNRCDRRIHSPFFRCVPCDFNLHEACMELPQVVESKIHWHPLTLYETFLEDDSGEYYCEHCEKTRDPRLGAYVCRQCKISLPRIYHIQCALPEIGKVYEKMLPSALEKLDEQIADKMEEIRTMKEEVRRMEEKLEEAKRELDELLKQLSVKINGVSNLEDD